MVKTSLTATLLLAALAALAAPLPAAEPALTVTSIGVGTGVADRELVGRSESFPADTGQLTCLTRVEGATAPTTVTHVWSRDGQETRRVELTVRTASWRTWSTKNVAPGRWTVRVLGPGGEEIGATSFAVGP